MIRRVALVAAVVACATAPAAAASDATSAEVAALAARAPSDPQALADLRAIDRVDGRPVDLAAALDARGPELAARLRVLAASATREAASRRPPAIPSRAAATILEERRFRGSDVPRPLHSPLRLARPRAAPPLRRDRRAATRRRPGSG